METLENNPQVLELAGPQEVEFPNEEKQALLGSYNQQLAKYELYKKRFEKDKARFGENRKMGGFQHFLNGRLLELSGHVLLEDFSAIKKDLDNLDRYYKLLETYPEFAELETGELSNRKTHGVEYLNEMEKQLTKNPPYDQQFGSVN